MITVWGSVIAAEGKLDDLLEISRAHARRSRGEAGCRDHGAYIDTEAPDRIVFFEKWTDEDALRRHFAVRESAEFLRRATALARDTPTIEIYRSEPLRI